MGREEKQRQCASFAPNIFLASEPDRFSFELAYTFMIQIYTKYTLKYTKYTPNIHTNFASEPDPFFVSWLTPSRSLSLDLDLVRARHLLKCKIELKLDSFYFELATNFQIHFQEYQVKLQVRMPWYEYEPLLTYG